MVKKIQLRNNHGFKVIKRFDEDIWNILANKETSIKRSRRIQAKKYITNGRNILDYVYEAYQNNFRYRELLKFHKNRFFLIRRRARFTYKVVTNEKEFIRKKRTIKIKHYLNLLKLRRFYGNLSQKKFKQLFLNSNLNSNFLGKSFICLLETRLDVLLYRAGFFNSIFAARQYILHKGLLVNGVSIHKPNYLIKLLDLIFLKDPTSFYKKIQSKIQKGKMFGNFPAYLEVNYKLGALILYKIPKVTEVPFPFFLNYKHIGYSFLKQR